MLPVFSIFVPTANTVQKVVLMTRRGWICKYNGSASGGESRELYALNRLKVTLLGGCKQPILQCIEDHTPRMLWCIEDRSEEVAILHCIEDHALRRLRFFNALKTTLR
jgi:hypothetical protein